MNGNTNNPSENSSETKWWRNPTYIAGIFVVLAAIVGAVIAGAVDFITREPPPSTIQVIVPSTSTISPTSPTNMSLPRTLTVTQQPLSTSGPAHTATVTAVSTLESSATPLPMPTITPPLRTMTPAVTNALTSTATPPPLRTMTPTVTSTMSLASISSPELTITPPPVHTASATATSTSIPTATPSLTPLATMTMTPTPSPWKVFEVKDMETLGYDGADWEKIEEGTGIIGLYLRLDEESPGDYLELGSNSDYTLEENGLTFSGRWKQVVDEIILIEP